MTKLSDTERGEAVKALIQWFDSQDINPQEAALVMIVLQARCLIDKTTNPIKLINATNLFRTALVCEIAVQLHEKAGQ
jgi:hypothetical protein